MTGSEGSSSRPRLPDRPADGRGEYVASHVPFDLWCPFLYLLFYMLSSPVPDYFPLPYTEFSSPFTTLSPSIVLNTNANYSS